MKRNCKYHPGERAVWYCHNDGIHFCDECVESAESSDVPAAKCLLCGKQLEMVGRQVAQEPFWTVLSRFTGYPMVRDPGLVMLAIGVAGGISAFLNTELIALAIVAVAGLVLGKYGASVIEATAEGSMKAPGILELSKPQGWDVGLQQWLLMVLACGGIGYSYVSMGMLTGSLIALAVWLFLPAMLVTVFLDRSIINMLISPQRMLGSMLSMNLDYFIAVLYLFSMFSACAIVVSILYDLLPGMVSWFLGSLVLGWFYLSMQHLLGYLIVQNRESLGYISQASAAEARRKKARKPLEERRQAMMLREGRYEKLVNEYKRQLEKKGGSLDFNDRYFRLLSQLGWKEEMLEQSDVYLTALLKQQQNYRVNELVGTYRKLDPAYKPGSAALTWDVAEAVHEMGQNKLAVNLLQDLHKRAPTWPGLPKAYLFIARILANDLNMKNKAVQYIKFVETRFRKPQDQELVAECRKELGV